MNILVVYPRPDEFKKPRFGFSYEMLMIATVFNKYHNVYIRDFSCEIYNTDEFNEYIQNKNIDVALVECDSYALKRSQNILHAKDIIGILNQYTKTIAYGTYCYITKKNFSNATKTITDNEINKIIECVNSFSECGYIPYIETYDELPHIDRRILLGIPYYQENKQNTLLQTAKGCENTCVFCQRRGWQSCYIAHSDDYVITEIEGIKKNGYRNVWIIDENFTFDLSRAKRILEKIINGRLHENMHFFISSWANIDKEFLDLAQRCNVKVISFGIESANEDILHFYRKNIDINNVPYIIRYANSIGIFTVGNFILGAPMETENTIKKTFELIRKCEFDQVNIKNLDYMIGSILYDSLDEMLKTEDHVFACAENRLNNFKLNDLKGKKEEFLSSYYREHRSTIERKIKIYGAPF